MQGLRIGRALARRPGLWATALRQAHRLAPSGWWRRPPFVPLPDPSVIAFRLETQYGDGDHPLDGHDLVTYLEWCRAEERARRRRRTRSRR